jgi:hypothetical protein
MRRYDIVSGILLILSIIDFALAAPVLAQENRQASIDTVHIPKDVLGKRWEENLEKLGEEYFKTGGNPVESSATLASSSSVPSGPEYGSTNVMQPPAPNPGPSTANPDPLMEASSCSPSTSSKQGLWARGNCLVTSWVYVLSALKDVDGLQDLHDGLHDDSLLYDPKASGYSADHERTGAQAPQPNLNPNPNPTLLIHPPAEPGLDWDDDRINAEDPPASPEDEVVHGPPTSPDPDHQSLSTDSQPVDLQAAIYAAKGKAKVSRRISGAARDVGNHAAQGDLQPAERSFDSGE